MGTFGDNPKNSFQHQYTIADAMTANDTQVGGNHYKSLAVEPWDAMEAWLIPIEFIGFLRGNIIKYHARAQQGKGSPEENLRKAAHYSRKLEEVLNKHFPPSVK